MRLASVASVLGLVLAPSLGGCPPSRDGDIMESRPSGSVRLSSAALGSLTLSPSRCTAGDRERFLGADFRDETGDAVLRLAIDPVDGPAVRVFSSAAPFRKTVVFRASECRVFNWSLEATTMRVNRIQDYRVALDLDCAGKSGDSIEGRVASRHCH